VQAPFATARTSPNRTCGPGCRTRRNLFEPKFNIGDARMYNQRVLNLMGGRARCCEGYAAGAWRIHSFLTR
jgi:hypothetical protein